MPDETDHFDPRHPFRSYSAYLRERYRAKVRRIALDAGFGCPHREGGRGSGGCLYCGPLGSGSGAFDRGVSLKEQLRRGVERLSLQGVDRYVAYLQAYCGTAGDPARLERAYREASSHPGVVCLSVGTRPDLAEDPVLELLAGFRSGKRGDKPIDVLLELGLQSAHDETLARINRGHDRACFDDAARRASKAGLDVAAHVILGLPGETPEMMMATAEHLADLPLMGVKLHQLYVEQGSAMAARFQLNEVRIMTLDEYVERAVDFLRRLPEEMVILRLAGGAPRQRLIAPEWALEPQAIRQAIERGMVSKGLRQGDRLKKS